MQKKRMSDRASVFFRETVFALRRSPDNRYQVIVIPVNLVCSYCSVIFPRRVYHVDSRRAGVKRRDIGGEAEV